MFAVAVAVAFMSMGGMFRWGFQQRPAAPSCVVGGGRISISASLLNSFLVSRFSFFVFRSSISKVRVGVYV